MAQAKQQAKQQATQQATQQAKPQTKQQAAKPQAKGNCSSNQYWNGNQCVNKPQSGQGTKKLPSRNTKKPPSGTSRRPSTPRKPGGGTKKPSGTTKKPNSKGCPSGQVKVGDTCVKGYQAKDGKCKKGDGLFQGNCFKQANVSEYIRRWRWYDGGGGGPASPAMIGNIVTNTINEKQVEIMYLGDGNAMYVDPIKGPIFGTTDIYGGNFSASSTQSQGSRRFVPLLLAAGALGIAGVAAAISYTQKKLKEYNQPLLSQEQINQAFGASKGSGKIPKNDVSSLGLKPGQTYNYQGKQYTLYQNGDSYTVGVMPCKGKCPNNVYGEQATALGNIATPWATVGKGNAPVPGVTKAFMTPGNVYKTKDGKTYVVNKDGKGLTQCKVSSVGAAGGGNILRSLEYRGISGDVSCGGGVPTQVSPLIMGALAAAHALFDMGPLDHPDLTYASHGFIPPIQRNILRQYTWNHPTSTYDDYTHQVIQSARDNANNQNTDERVPTVLSEQDFYRERALDYLIHGNPNRLHVYLPPDTIANVVRTFGSSSLRRIYGGETTFTQVLNTIMPTPQNAVLHSNEDIFSLPSNPNSNVTNTITQIEHLATDVHNNKFKPTNLESRYPDRWFNRVFNNIRDTYLTGIMQQNPVQIDNENRFRRRVAQVLLSSNRFNDMPQISNYLNRVQGTPQPSLPDFVLPESIAGISLDENGYDSTSGSIQFDEHGYAVNGN